LSEGAKEKKVLSSFIKRDIYVLNEQLNGRGMGCFGEGN
jgi:hypothetical protein